MKKVISLLLALVLCLRLCACGAADKQTGEDIVSKPEQIETTVYSDVQETTQCENTEATTSDSLQQMMDYYDFVMASFADFLNDTVYMAKQGTTYTNRQLYEFYQKFEACRGYGESEQILSRFTVFPDRLMAITNTTTDNLGNVKETTYAEYTYDREGNMIAASAILDYIGFTQLCDNVDVTVAYEYDPERRHIGNSASLQRHRRYLKDLFFPPIFS